MPVTKAILDYYRDMPFEKWVRFLNRNHKSKQLEELLMSLTDYSKLEQRVKGAEEPKTLKAGTEVKARIVSLRHGTSDKNNCDWYQVVFDVPDDPMVQEFNDFFWDLAADGTEENLDKKQFERGLYKFQTFCQCFDIDLSRPFDMDDDWPGLTGWVILGFKKDDEYGDSNTVKKYVTGPPK